MTSLYFEPSSDREDAPHVTQELIQGATVPQLLEWFGYFDQAVDHMRGQVEARQLTNTDDDDWVERLCVAYSLSCTARTRCRKRLKQLGVAAGEDLDEVAELKQRLFETQQANGKWKAMLREAGLLR